MTISVIVATYGDNEWMRLVAKRAYPSVRDQGHDEVFTPHYPTATRSESLNAAAAMSESDWLCFLDADDELAPGYIAAMKKAIGSYGPATASLYPRLFTPAVQHIRGGRPGQPDFMEQPASRRLTLRDYNWLVIGTLIHRDLFNEVGGFPDYPHGFEDFALWSKCYRAGATVIKVPDAVYRYHHNPQSAHKQAWRRRKEQHAMHRQVISELDAWEQDYAAAKH